MKIKAERKTVIIGLGYVGKAHLKLFPDAYVYDYYKQENVSPPKEDVRLLASLGSKLLDRDMVNKCDVAVVCVPTPPTSDGSCDTSIVESVLDWLTCKYVIIRSTVDVGTTEKLQRWRPRQNIVFCPEFIGEGNYFSPPWLYPDPKDPSLHDFVILGGNNTGPIAQMFLELNPHLKTLEVDSNTAEMIKYVVNSWIATKITFVNEIYDACQALGVPFTKVREGWLMDRRTERTFSTIFPGKRGFGGKCIPKDVSAIIRKLEKSGHTPYFLKSIVEENEKFINKIKDENAKED